MDRLANCDARRGKGPQTPSGYGRSCTAVDVPGYSSTSVRLRG